MFTEYQIETASVYMDENRGGLRSIVETGIIIDTATCLIIIREIREIIVETTVIDGVAVRVDWLMQTEELAALLSIVETCRSYNR